MAKSARKVLDKYEEELLKKPFVVSCWAEKDRIVVLQQKNKRKYFMTHEIIPKELDKIPVIIRKFS
jgi:hypothetical protein